MTLILVLRDLFLQAAAGWDFLLSLLLFLTVLIFHFALIASHLPLVSGDWCLLYLDWVHQDVTLDVIIVVAQHWHNKLVLIVMDLIRDLAPADDEVLLHILEGFKSQIHVDCRDGLRPVLLWVEQKVLLDLQLVNRLPPLLSRAVLDALALDFESYTHQFGLDLADVLAQGLDLVENILIMLIL